MSWRGWKLESINTALHRFSWWGGVLLLALVAGCVKRNIEVSAVSQKIDSVETAVLMVNEETVEITLADLEVIRTLLLQWLEDRSENPDFDRLRRVTSEENCFITPDGVARIGAWALRARSGGLALERTVPRNPGTTYLPVATLEKEEGRWKVLGVSAVVMRAL